MKQIQKKTIALTIGLALSTLLGCSLLSKPVPKCDSPDVTNLVKQALHNSPRFAGRLVSFSLGIPGETRYRTTPTPKRVCRTTLTTSTSAGSEVLFYSVEWQDKKKGIIWVSTMGPKDDGT